MSTPALLAVPSQDQVYQAMVAFLVGIMGTNDSGQPLVPVIRELPNRASTPSPDPGYISVQALFDDRLRMAIETFTQGGDTLPTTFSIEQGMEIRFQIDCWGKHSGTWASIISTAFQSSYGCNALAPNCQPLYCNQARMVPLTDAEQQYEERWSLEAHVQYNPVVTAAQQYADELELEVVDVNVRYPLT